MSEVHVNLGDVYAYLDRDTESEAEYKNARDICVKARDICRDVVSDEILQEMEALVNGNGEDEEEQSEDEDE